MSKKVVIYGGRGALGSTMVAHFQSCGWWVCSVDLAASDAADANVIVDPKADWLAQERLREPRTHTHTVPHFREILKSISGVLVLN